MNSLKVVRAFRVAASWTIPPVQPKASTRRLVDMARDHREGFSLNPFGFQSDGLPALLTPRPKQPITVVFLPIDRELVESLASPENPEDECHLLFHELHFLDLEEHLKPKTEKDQHRLKNHLRAANDIRYIRFESGHELIVFGTPLVFEPNEEWVPQRKHGQKHSRKGGKRCRDRPASCAERRHASVIVKHIGLRPQPGAVPQVSLSPDYPTCRIYSPRFGVTVTLDHEWATSVQPDTYLDPEVPLRRCYDPAFRNLPSVAGNNALSNLENISIPLVWPDNWDRPELAPVLSLKTWGERSWGAFIAFLEGKCVDSLEDLPEPDAVEGESSEVSRVPKGSTVDLDRTGQCYHGSYCSITIRGPYFIFGVEIGEQTVYVVDSPFYGIALRIFWRAQDASNYARGGEHRRAVEDDPTALVAPKIVHDPKKRWLDQVRSVFDAIRALEQ